MREYRVNEKIKGKEVRVIGENGEQLGVMTVRDALQAARERNTDLVEVAPTAQPPVCRMLDFGKFKYEQAKKEREAHKKQKVISLRQIRLRPKTGDHDLDVKVAVAVKLLEKGNKVKFVVLFRGREMTHPQLGKQMLDKVVTALAEKATVERPPALEGNAMSLILGPQSTKQVKKEKDKVKAGETVNA
ncbi:MAG: translation initiation factor IF-3 [Chloroflexi bacterium]|nr:translation initiation factor IF-3 [Chloroflexota bacterium]